MGSLGGEQPDVAPLVDLKKLSARAAWAQLALRKNIAAVQTQLSGLPVKADAFHILPIANTLHKNAQDTPDKPLKVGIIGAGVAGLFTAMIFDQLKEKFNLDVDYEILESNSSQRLGGRLYTHHFEGGDANDYYDVGAMRFPDIDIMQRTFELFKQLDMQKWKTAKEDPDPPQLPKKGQLIPYFLGGPKNTALYNGKQITLSDTVKPTARQFGIPEENVPGALQDTNPTDIWGKAVDYWVQQYKAQYQKGKQKEFWDELMKTGDTQTVRQYLSRDYSYYTTEFLETLNFGNRWYDQAFSEALLETLDFNEDAEWFCVQGGSNEIAQRMAASLKQHERIHYDHKVTAMKYLYTENPRIPGQHVVGTVEVDITNPKTQEKQTKTYDAVFNSAPLGAMQHMHLEGLNLNWGTKQAIRSLGYGASCKVGIRFNNKWWMKAPYSINQGGSSKTDLPIRCCVYPSYNIRKPEGDTSDTKNKDEPGTLLVSYTWSQEAERIGALIKRESPNGEDELKQLLFHDLARLHTSSDEDYEKLRTELEQAYMTHYAYNWYADENTVGAFAFFGPQQFSNMYQWVTRSNGKHVIIGEAASAHHAWVVGSLESAVRGVYQFLYKHDDNSACQAAVDAYSNWHLPENKEKLPGPFGPLPYEYDRTKDVEYMDTQGEKNISDSNSFNKKVASADLPSPLGEFARLQVFIENLRLEDPKQGGDQIKGGGASALFLEPVIAATSAVAA